MCIHGVPLKEKVPFLEIHYHNAKQVMRNELKLQLKKFCFLLDLNYFQRLGSLHALLLEPFHR